MMITFSRIVEEAEAATNKAYATILCPECGAPTVAREESVLCLSCAASEDWRRPLQQHIARYPKVVSFVRCPGCERVLVSDPNKKPQWGPGDHDSDELLGLLLRRVKAALLGKRAVGAIEGMSRALAGGELQLEDARFVWTEPHSRRVKLEVVVAHKPAARTTAAAARFHECEIEFYEERRRCEDCLGEQKHRGRKMGQSGGEFAARVQVRAKRLDGGSGGARTLGALEDSLRDTSANATATAARRVAKNHGFDVEFAAQREAAKFLTDLRRLGRAPLKFEDATKKLVTHDEHTNTSDWQRTTLVYVPPIDKHDLVVDDVNVFSLVLNVRASIRLVDVTGRSERDVTADQYFRKPFDAILSTANMLDFTVVDDGMAQRLHEQPRRFFAPFDCKLGRVYRGYDLDAVAHRVHVAPGVPRVVLVIPAPLTGGDGPATSFLSDKKKSVPSRKDRRKLSKKHKKQLAAAQTVEPHTSPKQHRRGDDDDEGESDGVTVDEDHPSPRFLLVVENDDDEEEPASNNDADEYVVVRPEAQETA
ncbi:hypothetical protein CTAYLR_008389 [Chrysophaeum taylorii]|uniref:60S ribosomal export protein NMD3 n=1 Tax=Chrysophaeum taylorii TaxID=2483200 RepID=A0AAD7UHP7_9STRA|nr:hypothetical protein CTAYLR_008389 [Chrysophaeum taylorii]